MQDLGAEPMQNLESGNIKSKQSGDATFMTAVQNPGLQSQKTKGPKTRKEFGEDAQPSATQSKEEIKEENQFDGSDIDLNASYSDSDKEVPFKQSKEVIEYLFDLERQDRTEINRV